MHREAAAHWKGKFLHLTSTPAKIDDALAAAIRVLRGFRAQRVTQREVERARMTLLTRHETELKTNAYWVDLMQYTALGDALAPAKDVTCIADLPAMYEAATVEDLYEVYSQLGLTDGDVFTCVTVAGAEDPALRISRGERLPDPEGDFCEREPLSLWAKTPIAALHCKKGLLIALLRRCGIFCRSSTPRNSNLRQIQPYEILSNNPSVRPCCIGSDDHAANSA